MIYTKIYGVWNFGNCSWLGPGTNPVLFAALAKNPDGTYSNMVRLIRESVDDYNLPPGTLEYAAALPVSGSNPPGMNFSPGGIGYAVHELGTRNAIYRQYHGGQYPPWSPAPEPEPKEKSKLKKWLKIIWG